MKLENLTEKKITWVDGNLSDVPYILYKEDKIFEQEQEKIFRGNSWNYLCLEAELNQPGDFRTTFVGTTPVIVIKDDEGDYYAFENRCVHRGALIALERQGNAKSFQCVYHAWNYDQQGNLTGIAFENGVNGKGGMDKSFCKDEHGPRKLRVETFAGLIFGTFSEDVPEIEEYLGPEIAKRITRVLGKPVEVLGRYTQKLPNNWKLYFENVKDSYHASLLHMFFTTFEINRLSQKGGIIVDETGGHHVSYSMIDGGETTSTEYKDQGIRADNNNYRLADPSMLEGFDEIGDGITLQILSVFPGLVVQQIQNCLAVRHVLPKGVDATELHWTLLGYTDDTPEVRELRLKQGNLVGTAGFISMEDGAVGNFVQRGISGADDLNAFVRMGGDGAESQTTRATETSVRGFWKAYRTQMGM